MTRLRVAVVDDEELARRVVLEALRRHADVEVVAECANGYEAVAAVAEHRPDLLFLDVQMPRLSGFDVLELVEDFPVAVVFVTAFEEFAIRAFEVHAVDYLLKPFEDGRFDEALSRARQRLGAPLPVRAARLGAAARREGQHLERVLVREGSRVHLIPVAEVDYVSADDDYVTFHASGREVRRQQTLAEVEAALDPARFVRIHRSFVANVARIERIVLYAKDSRLAELAGGVRLPLSRAGHRRLRERL